MVLRDLNHIYAGSINAMIGTVQELFPYAMTVILCDMSIV